jgi:hypothetical protein
MVMTTFNALAEEVSRKLAGFTLRQDRQTHLTASVNTTDTTISIDSANNISTGIVQIDSELIYVNGYDRVANTLSIPPYGRGYNGTSQQSHQTGSRVVISPTFPIVDIKQAINDTILSIGKDIYVTATTTFSYSPAVSTYALPDELDNVLAVSYQTTGPTKEWLPIRAYRIDKMANVATWNTGKTITLIQGVEPGRTVQVFYTALPTQMENDSDDFEVVTGLPASCRDVLVLGASYRLASYVDPGRLTFGSAEADQQSQIAGRAYGSGTNAAKYLLALYQQRLNEEVAKLQNHYPIRVTYTN